MSSLDSISRRGATTIALGGVFVLASALTWGQQQSQTERPVVRRITVDIVKPDHVMEYEAAVKQYHTALAKIPGVRNRTVFQSLTGDREYMLVRDYAKFGDLDSDNPVAKAMADSAELARINIRINNCVEKRTSRIEEVQSELTLPRKPGPPKLIVLSRTRLTPSKVQDWMAAVKDELKPAHEKAGQSLTTRRVVFGGSRSEFTTWVRMDSWADRDKPNPIRAAMGDEAYRKMTAKLAAATEDRTINILRYRGDLGFTSQPGTPSGGN